MARVKKLPKGFYLGAATAAYQVEGATKEAPSSLEPFL